MRVDTNVYWRLAEIHKEEPEEDLRDSELLALQPNLPRVPRKEVHGYAVDNYVARLKDKDFGEPPKVYKCKYCDFVVPGIKQMTEAHGMSSLFSHSAGHHPEIVKKIKMENELDSFLYGPNPEDD